MSVYRSVYMRTDLETAISLVETLLPIREEIDKDVYSLDVTKLHEQTTNIKCGVLCKYKSDESYKEFAKKLGFIPQSHFYMEYVAAGNSEKAEKIIEKICKDLIKLCKSEKIIAAYVYDIIGEIKLKVNI